MHYYGPFEETEIIEEAVADDLIDWNEWLDKIFKRAAVQKENFYYDKIRYGTNTNTIIYGNNDTYYTTANEHGNIHNPYDTIYVGGKTKIIMNPYGYNTGNNTQ